MKINLEITVFRLNINQMLKCETTNLCLDYGRVIGLGVGSIISDTISTTSVWSSSKTNEEINKLLPLIYAGL